jgi:hypothetical protein
VISEGMCTLVVLGLNLTTKATDASGLPQWDKEIFIPNTAESIAVLEVLAPTPIFVPTSDQIAVLITARRLGLKAMGVEDVDAEIEAAYQRMSSNGMDFVDRVEQLISNLHVGEGTIVVHWLDLRVDLPSLATLPQSDKAMLVEWTADSIAALQMMVPVMPIFVSANTTLASLINARIDGLMALGVKDVDAAILQARQRIRSLGNNYEGRVKQAILHLGGI